ncbi:HIT family protein [Ideonella livida]|uniref:HIT family protein n=1 Tax=Ideonella livida TaxID=2707176 RepID=A0A7C9PET7_9BURK|nr:HIT family protein [Ideonella livida]NDY89995.1 HIT family protein [Ideonella livida]
MSPDACPLCLLRPEDAVWHDAHWQVIRAQESGFPAFYRLVLRRHAAEFTDLTATERQRCMSLVAVMEHVLRDTLQPTKINLATLGNVVPHLHWHVIARFEGDSHFPQPVWAAPVRAQDPAALASLSARLPQLEVRMREALDACGPCAAA